MLPEPPHSTATHFYRYGSAAGVRLSWLERIILKHRSSASQLKTTSTSSVRQGLTPDQLGCGKGRLAEDLSYSGVR